MFNNKFNKKAQAAIEFLMTYGWMLLVVLIVGALVFSFVDFGSLLPNEVKIATQDILSDVSGSNAYSSQYTAVAADQSLVYIAFLYQGVGKTSIDANDSSLTSSLSNKDCAPVSVSNDRVNGTQIDAGASVAFLGGQPGTLVFNCDHDGSTEYGPLLEGDTIEGTLSIGVKDVKRASGARAIQNPGTFRLKIQ
jgi:hypothetical protein